MTNTKILLHRRKTKEVLFKAVCIFMILAASTMLFALLASIVKKGYTAFYTHEVTLSLNLNEETLFNEYNYSQTIEGANYGMIIQESLDTTLASLGMEERLPYSDIVSDSDVFNFRSHVVENPDLVGKQIDYTFLISSNADMWIKGHLNKDSIISTQQANVIDTLVENKQITSKLNSLLLTNNDSRNPEVAGINGAFWGTVYTIALTIIFSIVIGLGAAIYLEEFAPKNKAMSLLEVNINNLAAVPSIVFGLLGLVLFQQFLGLPRSTPLLASMVLTLMSLPTIIITSRIAMSSVPKSIQNAAYAMGATQMQVISQHTLPVAMPGILTGVIISISRALGESAPILMIGMLAFINSAPSGFTDKATAFPMQILLWSGSPEIGFIEKASAAIMLMLSFLIFVNAISIYLRNKYEVKF